MRIARRTEIKVKLTSIEFLEALGISDEGYLQEIKQEGARRPLKQTVRLGQEGEGSQVAGIVRRARLPFETNSEKVNNL